MEPQKMTEEKKKITEVGLLKALVSGKPQAAAGPGRSCK